MKKILAIIVAFAAICSCTKATEENIFCNVTLHAFLPDGRQIVSLTVDPSLPGNIFKNMNTGINYQYPVFVNNECTMQVQKGVYMIAFDAQAMFIDGSVSTVRFTAWKNPISAITLLRDEERLEIELKLLK